MELCRNTFEEFELRTREKKLIAVAPSQLLKLVSTNYQNLRLHEKVAYFVDNDYKKQGKAFTLLDNRIPIFPVEKLLYEKTSDIVLLICSAAYAMEIYRQLEAMDALQNTACFFLPYMIAERSDNCLDNLLDMGNCTKEQIPKIIHCFWFSKEKKDALSTKCMESWRRACPDYQILEWNADNYDVEKKPYMLKAYEMRKWAFVSDYARLDIIYQMGGFYLDFDVELFKSLDCLRRHKFVIGYGPYRDIEAAAFGAVAGNGFTKGLIDIYAERNFSWEKVIEGDIQPVYLNQLFSSQGFTIDGRYQEKDGVCVYPKEVFSDRNPFTEEIRKGEYALGVHHCAGGWWSNKDREYHDKSIRVMKEIEKLYGKCNLMEHIEDSGS